MALNKKDKELVLLIAGIALVAIIVSMILRGFYVLINIEKYDYTVSQVSEELIYPSNEDSEPQKFLWSSSVNSEMVYNYMVKSDKNGGYHQKTIPADKTFIFYIENESEIPVIIEQKRDYGTFKNIVSPMHMQEEYHVYVPKGSVVNTVSIENE